MFKAQRIRDPLHNLIVFRAEEFEDVLWRVVQTRPFQRLRRVKQLGFSDLVYPGATHSRFAHSVGVFHTARQLMAVIENHLGANYLATKARVALAASLVHDVGHGPFSHAFEDVGRRLDLRLADHEHVSDLLIRSSDISEAFRPLGSGFANDVADVIKSRGPGSIYSAVVSSQFDADRLDYMRRDRLMTGTHHGAIDFEWLIANLEVGNVPYGVDEKSVGAIETFVLGPKATYAAETYVLGLFQLYPTVYFHKATRGAEKLFSELLFQTISLARNGNVDATGLSGAHPLIRFAVDPENIDNVLSLDDTVVWGALSPLAEARDGMIADFARRLRDRRLFKCVDVRAQVARSLRDQGGQNAALEKICVSINEKIGEWLADNETHAHRILVDEATREPYKRFQESKGPLNQVRIKTDGGELADLGERSRIVKAIEPFHVFRLYFADTDNEAKTFVDQTIEWEIKNVAAG